MDINEIMDDLISAARTPDWWSAGASALGLIVATFALRAASRAARAAMAAYRAQAEQVQEMKKPKLQHARAGFRHA